MKVLEKDSCDYLECSFIEYKSILEFQEFTKDTDFRGILLVSYYNGSKEFPLKTKKDVAKDIVEAIIDQYHD